MTAQQNKDVVRRFMTEVLSGGQFDRIDELLAPGYVARLTLERIVQDDPITTPDLTQQLGPLIEPAHA